MTFFNSDPKATEALFKRFDEAELRDQRFNERKILIDSLPNNKCKVNILDSVNGIVIENIWAIKIPDRKDYVYLLNMPISGLGCWGCLLKVENRGRLVAYYELQDDEVKEDYKYLQVIENKELQDTI